MPENFLEPPHLFVEKTNISGNQDTAYLALLSGGEPSVFVFTPDHLKQLGRAITNYVEAYEKKYGALAGRLPSEPLKSPLQFNGENETLPA